MVCRYNESSGQIHHSTRFSKSSEEEIHFRLEILFSEDLLSTGGVQIRLLGCIFLKKKSFRYSSIVIYSPMLTLWHFKDSCKILQSGFYWPLIYRFVYIFVTRCDRCQDMENIFRRNEMPLNNIQEVELFNLWNINFMVIFFPRSQINIFSLQFNMSLNGQKQLHYLLTCLGGDKFLEKYIFTWYSTSRVIIND